MASLIQRNLRYFFIKRNIIILCMGIIAMITYSVINASEYSFLEPLEYYTFIIGAFLPILFPLIIIMICNIQFSSEIKNRFIMYKRFRETNTNYLVSTLVSNLIIVFIVVFSFTFIPFIFAFYIEPFLQIIQYEPENLYNMTLEERQQTSFTYSQLMQFHPLVFATTYAIWVGVNGGLYSMLGFLFLLVLENRFIALSIPFLLYHLGSFIIAILGIPAFLFDATIFPFNINQHEIWTTFIPFSFILMVCVTLGIYIKKNRFELSNLQ